jgi:hypothetical protein
VEALLPVASARDWVTSYLLGRALVQAGRGAEALAWLAQTRSAPGCPQTVAEEARRLEVDSAVQAGRCAWLEQVAADAATLPGSRARAADGAERCHFAAKVKSVAP